LKRGIKKTIAAMMGGVMIFMLPVFSPIMKAADNVLNKVSEDDFDDAATMGDGVFAKSGNSFENMSDGDQYYYIAEDGTKTSLTEAIKAQNIDAFYRTTTGVNYLLNGVVVAGHENKVAFMDKDGELWGEPIYSSVLYVNDNMFFGSTSEQNGSGYHVFDGWGLYKKDGTLIDNLDTVPVNYSEEDASSGVKQPETVIENNRDNDAEESYEITMETDENGEVVARIQDSIFNKGYSYVHNKLLCLSGVNGIPSLRMYNEDGTKVMEVENIRRYYVSESSDYIGAVDTANCVQVYNYSGEHLFTAENCNYFDVEELQKYGYAGISGNRIVDANGNVVVQGDDIAGFDSQAAVVWNGEEAKLVNMNQEDLFPITPLYEEMVEDGYKLTSTSVYYNNSHLFVSIYQKNDNNEAKCATKVFNLDGEVITSVDGYWLAEAPEGVVNEEYMLLKNTDYFKRALFDLAGNQLTDVQSNLNFWYEGWGAADNLIAYSSTYQDAKMVHTLIFRDGTTIECQSRPFYINNRAVISSDEGTYVINGSGGVMIPAGQYNDFMLSEYSPYIIGLYENGSDVLDESGQVLNDRNEYTNVSHTAIFSDFKNSSGQFQNGITSNGMLVAENKAGKVNIVKVGKVLKSLDPLSAINDQIYTGNPVKPNIIVTSGGAALTEGTDYTIEFFENTAVGKGKVVITGIGEYTGTQEAEFNIVYKKSEAPENVTAAFTNDNFIKVSWKKVDSADGYIIYRKDSKTNNYKYLMMTSKNTVLSLIDKEVSKSNIYSYRVYSYNNYDQRILGPASKEATAKATVLSGVKNVAAAPAGKNKVKLTWSVVKNADGYLIYAQKDGKYGYCGMTSGASFTDKKAIDSDYNFYWVFAYEKDTDGKMIPGESGKYVFAKGIVPTVTGMKASSAKGSVNLSWNKVTDAQGYLVYGKTASGKYGYIGMTSETVFVDKKASKNEYNFYWVYAYYKNNAGNNIVSGAPKYVYGKAK
jgi:fibronectin type 3 domain-containing protein